MKQNKTNIVEKNQETTLEFSEQDFLEVKAMVAKSAYCLGRCYETGIGTDKNETEAVRLYSSMNCRGWIRLNLVSCLPLRTLPTDGAAAGII